MSCQGRQEPQPDADLTITWSPAYHPAWDATPQDYVDGGVVAPGRSRRLAKLVDARRGFTAYLGVQHFEPSRWHLPGEPLSRFFASLFVRKRTVALHTFPTMAEALAAVGAFHAALDPQRGDQPSP